MKWHLVILDKNEDISLIEDLQRRIWPGSDIEVVPTHMLQAAVHNGGLLIVAYQGQENSGSESVPEVEVPLGFVFGFPGFYLTGDGPRLKHCSHMLGVDPRFRNQGLGFALKRAQWQMVRKQGIDRITWTFDPLLSPNAHLNICRLGAVCNTYYRNYYGNMIDDLNAGLPTDRFQVDWWVNSKRVNQRLSKKPRPVLHLSQFTSANVQIVNRAEPDQQGWLHPSESKFDPPPEQHSLIMIEIPTDIQAIKKIDPGLALEWRLHTRSLFESFFNQGYLVTDFIHEKSEILRSYYILIHGESTL